MKKSKVIILLLAAVLTFGVLFSLSFVSSAEEEAFTPKMSVTMADNLIFNIYVPKSDKLTSVTLDGVKKDISSLPTVNGYHHIKIPLDVCDADREIKLSVVLESENGNKKGTFTLSAVKYVSMLISGNESNATKKLAKDILAYINSAKKFFGEEPSAAIESILSGYNSEFSPLPAENTANGLKFASFVLGARPSVRFYIADGYEASDFTFSRGEKVLTVKEGSDKNGSYVEIFSSAYAMIETISYTLDDIDGEGKYNLSSYVDYVKNEYNGSDKALLTDLAEKFYIYCESAAAYRREVLISLCDHTYTSSVKVEATALKEGIMEYTCDKCTNTYEERIPTTLKVLAIGNSFSEDSFKHLYLVAKSAGIENVVLGNFYRGGCSLATHYKLMQSESGESCIFYISDDKTGGMVKEAAEGVRNAKYAITYTDWDYISIQQASNYSGLPEKYEDLQGVIDYVNANKTSDAEILWHMTWAYQENSTHSGFANYGNDQMTMYNSIVNTVKSKILTNSDISGVIPSGTAVQNLRTSVLGDTLTRDGYHLSHGIGRYTAALTWIAYITGCDVDKITATPSEYPEVAASLDYIKDAVKKAIAKPYEVTESAYPKPETPEPEAPEKLLNTTLSSLSEGDRAYLTANGFDPDGYMLLDLDAACNLFYNSTHSTKYAERETQATTSNQYMKWWSTQILSKNELINGSIIRVDNGTKYRPEGWIDMKKNSTRPNTVDVKTDNYYVLVDDAWWGDYNYRGFNIGKVGGGSFTDADYETYAKDSETRTFKIYIPIVKRAELTAEDRQYLESQGLNPDLYQVLDFEYLLDHHYNSSLRGAVAAKSTGAQAYKFAALEIMSRYDLTLGTVIRLTGTNHNYRPDGWLHFSEKYTGTRPATVSAVKTVVDAAWWGDFAYRGINLQNRGATADSPVSDADVSLIRIYVPIVNINGLSDDDIAYLKSLGLDPTEYKVLDLEIAYNAYYNSSTGFGQYNDKSTSSNYQKFLATQVFSKSDLTDGSVIRIKSGYKYRPDGWVDLSTKTPKEDRPANVSTETVIIDDAWWGDFNYRGFNIAKSSGTITLEEGENFKIYVKIK